MKALITGIAGFAGSHLAEFLLAHSELEMSGLVHDRSQTWSIYTARWSLHHGDLLDPHPFSQYLTAVQPDFIFHLAGQSFVPSVLEQPLADVRKQRPWPTESFGSRRQVVPRARVLIVGSNEEYGGSPRSTSPSMKNAPLRPDSPYGVSKAAQDLMALQYYFSRGLATLRVRPFNHIGPRQSERFVASALARQIAEMEAGVASPRRSKSATCRHSAISPTCETRSGRTTWSPNGAIAGEVYNIGSGVPHSIQALLDILLDLAQAELKAR